MAGTFIVSLDFELFWGVRDVTTLAAYGAHIRGVREAIPAILGAFASRGVRATWATVGFLFARSKRELIAALPENRPRYATESLCPYRAIEGLGDDEEADPYHFGAELLDAIQKAEGQEIASHTFSHYYALEEGQTRSTFRDDLRAAFRIAEARGVNLRSLVFPRNQYNAEYVEVCRELGITSYRGNEDSWIYAPRQGSTDPSWRRGARLLDAYLNMSGHHTYSLRDVARTGPPYNLPSSRFLRPWSPRLDALEEARLRRIERAMTYAARNDEVFHLWWHPHNFGVNLANNMANLQRLLTHFEGLRARYNMESASMGDVALSLASSARTGASA